MAAATYKFNRTTNGPVKVTTTNASGTRDEYFRDIRTHISGEAGIVVINFDIGDYVIKARPNQITEIAGAPFAGTLAQAVAALGENIFY